MAKTSTSERLSRTISSVVDKEARHFGAMAADWWDPNGSSAMLHKLNPVRLCYIRDMIDQHWQADEHGFRPLTGKNALDVGCGAGLLAEPLARLGAKVTAVDAAPELIEVAKAHAEGQGLAIDYRATGVEEVGGKFDLVTAMEVVEHVADIGIFIGRCAAMLKPGGMMVVSTLSRTWKSFALAIVGAEYILRWLPRGTHRWDKFVTPDELAKYLLDNRLTITEQTGVVYSPFADKWSLASDMDVNYMVIAEEMV